MLYYTILYADELAKLGFEGWLEFGPGLLVNMLVLV